MLLVDMHSYKENIETDCTSCYADSNASHLINITYSYLYMFPSHYFELLVHPTIHSFIDVFGFMV